MDVSVTTFPDSWKETIVDQDKSSEITLLWPPPTITLYWLDYMFANSLLKLDSVDISNLEVHTETWLKPGSFELFSCCRSHDLRLIQGFWCWAGCFAPNCFENLLQCFYWAPQWNFALWCNGLALCILATQLIQLLLHYGKLVTMVWPLLVCSLRLLSLSVSWPYGVFSWVHLCN